MLLTPPTSNDTPRTPHTHRHYAHRRTPTPDVTNVYLRYPMQPTYVTNISPPYIPARTAVHLLPMQPTYPHNVCPQHTPAIYPYNISPQRMSTTYTCDISLQHIPNTYPHNISLTHIPIIYLQNQPHHIRLWTFLVTYGKLWLVLVNNGESW